MITYLCGHVLEVLEDCIWLKVQDVGYEIVIHPKHLIQILPDQQREVYCHMMLSENDIKLYGFLQKEELLLFRRLTTISGIGGKLAQTIVASMPVTTFVQAIVTGDEKVLLQVPGVGKKMASRLIFELKDKLIQKENILITGDNKDKTKASQGKMLAEVVEAMEALGYSRNEVYPLLISLREENVLRERTEENIRLLLKRLAEKGRC